MEKLFNARKFIFAVVCVAAMLPSKVWAADSSTAVTDNPLAVALLIIAGILALVIGLLGYVVIGAAQLKLERYKKGKANAVKTIAVVALCLLTTGTFAADDGASSTTVAEVVTDTIGGMSKTTFYSVVTVIGLELAIILWLLVFLRSFIAAEPVVKMVAVEVQKESAWKKWWDKVNSFRGVHEEAQIDTGHNYDNIRELDNKLPPWWLYGFYLTIIFSGIYLWRYHVSHSAPLSMQEYEIAMEKAEEEKANNLKKAGNSVDENTVKLLTAAADIDAGKKIFVTTCAPCHGADGGGVVGPNLTDDYWLHGGSVNEVFKTIKYGVAEKGMQPWKGTFSPNQIAQLASFIKSIHGAKVTNPKEPQGELYKDTPAAADTTKLAAVNQGT